GRLASLEPHLKRPAAAGLFYCQIPMNFTFMKLERRVPGAPSFLAQIARQGRSTEPYEIIFATREKCRNTLLNASSYTRIYRGWTSRPLILNWAKKSMRM